MGADKRGSTVTWRLRAGKKRVFDTPPGDAQPPPAHPPSPTQILPKDRGMTTVSVQRGFAPLHSHTRDRPLCLLGGSGSGLGGGRGVAERRQARCRKDAFFLHGGATSRWSHVYLRPTDWKSQRVLSKPTAATDSGWCVRGVCFTRFLEDGARDPPGGEQKEAISANGPCPPPPPPRPSRISLTPTAPRGPQGRTGLLLQIGPNL